MPKIILMISFLILFLHNTCFANAKEKNNNINNELNNEMVTEYVENAENTKNAENSGLVYIALAICSDSSSEFTTEKSNFQESFGHHSWLAITNLGEIAIRINGIEIQVFETITVGTWQGGIHNGIFYNVERYFYEKGEFSNTKSAYKMMLLNDFELNYFISLLSHPENDTWTITNNCSAFVERLWNMTADDRISAGIIKCPLKLYENIILSDGKKGLIISSPGFDLYYGGKNPQKFEL